MISDFVVIDALSAYNVILGRPTLNQTKVVVAMYSLVVKFPTAQGMGMMKWDHATTQSCYVSSLRKTVALEALHVKEMDPMEKNDRVSPIEELTQVVLDQRFPK